MSTNALRIIILTSFITQISNYLTERKFYEALYLSSETMGVFHRMYLECAGSTIPSQHFLMDDLKNFVNYPSKTTVGFAPKFTANRKFFANIISSRAFKNMLEQDVEELRKQFMQKLKYCGKVIMDKNIVKDLYDRDVDQGKL